MKHKGRWTNCARLQETKETWHLNAMYAPRLDPRLGGNDYKKHYWHPWGNLNMNFRLKYYIKSEVTRRVWLFTTQWTVANQPPPSMGFSRQEYWSGLPFPSPGDLLTQGLNPSLPHCRQMLYHLSHQGSPTLITSKLQLVVLIIVAWLCKRSPCF